MKKVIRTTPIISVTTMQGFHDKTGEDTGLYYALYVNGKWENEFYSFTELNSAIQAIIMGVTSDDV